MSTDPANAADAAAQVDLKPLLAQMWPGKDEPVSADAIAAAISHFFTNSISDVQAGALLMCLHFTGWDRRADVLAKTASTMLQAAAPVYFAELRAVVEKRQRAEGAYQGGLCDIVGTGGDSHNTFNISTAASILASSLLVLAKHGNKASTSKSGSADILAHMGPPAPQLARVRPDTLARVYAATNYAFLFAPVFHPAMKFVAPVRRALPWRTIFNLVGPLAHPVDGATPSSLLEARVIGVARKDLGPLFAEALRLRGAQKAMVVCGDEDLDEVSCAGPTLCWKLSRHPTEANATATEHFLLTPADFGLPSHPLSAVSPGKEPAENAAILTRILRNELPEDDPILHFVLMNAAALFVVSGICEADTSAMGPGDDGQVIKERGPGHGRWKEGIRRARWAIQSGSALQQWESFVHVTNTLDE